MEQDLTDHAWRSSTLVCCCHRTSSSTTLVLAGACLPSLIGRIVVALASSCAHHGRVAVRASDLGLDIIISFATRGSDLPPTPAISMWRGAEATGSDPHKVIAPNRAEEATTVPPPQPPMGVGWIREQLAASLKEEFPGRYATARRADASVHAPASALPWMTKWPMLAFTDYVTRFPKAMPPSAAAAAATDGSAPQLTPRHCRLNLTHRGPWPFGDHVQTGKGTSQ